MNSPNRRGWAIAAAAGLVVFGLLVVVGKFNLFPAAALGCGVAVIVWLVLGMPRASGSAPAEPAQRVRKIVVEAAPAEPVAPVPVAETLASPATFVFADAAPTPKAAPEAMPEAAPKAAPRPAPKAASGTAAKPKAAARAKSEKPVAEKPVPKAAPKPRVAKPAGPVRLKAARKGGADDLKEIEGIGPALERLVNSLGFYHFDQIAGWSDADVALVDAEMKTFRGRIARDKWVAQAGLIVGEGLEAFRERAKTNDY